MTGKETLEKQARNEAGLIGVAEKMLAQLLTDRETATGNELATIDAKIERAKFYIETRGTLKKAN